MIIPTGCCRARVGLSVLLQQTKCFIFAALANFFAKIYTVVGEKNWPQMTSEELCPKIGQLLKMV